MARDDIEIRIPLDYPTVKQVEKQAQREGTNRGARARKLVRAALALQRLVPHPALLDALADLQPEGDSNSEQMIRRLLRSELGGN